MSDFLDAMAGLNQAQLDVAGEPVTYQPADGGSSTGAPFSVNAVRHERVRDEAGAIASFEEISVNPTDFSTAPKKGDWVSAWGANYVVTNARQPFAYGLMTLSLEQRA